MYDIQVLLKQAIDETEKLNKGEEFLLRDLFKGYEWNRISRKYRIVLGTLFLDYIRENHPTIEAIEKTSSKQQMYKKTKLESAPFGRI
ncbi:MAG: single-stranded DNA-binding protein [Herbinix sp.]|nr:single-stranded DNA-binding protein [Herbinix sp.]